MTQPWYWPLAAAGHGPDWFFAATFDLTLAEPLASLVREQPLPDFGHYRVENSHCRCHQRQCTYDLYIDLHNYDRMVANFTSPPGENIWIYHTIAVCGSDIRIERGYGGYPGDLADTETALILLLAQAPNLPLLSWQIGYSGDGLYASGTVATGATASELLAALS